MAQVTVRHARLDVTPAEADRLEGLIDPLERARADRFRYKRDRRRFVVRRGRLREWLGARVGEAPERLTFGAGPHGKPVLQGGGPHFSASHSGEAMLLAMAPIEVGCDMEQVDLDFAWRPVAEQLFSPAERAKLAALGEIDGRRAFFNCWARKEAFVKGLGQGLSYPLDAFEVSLGDDARLCSGGRGWSMTAGALPSDCVFAIVFRSPAIPRIDWVTPDQGVGSIRLRPANVRNMMPRTPGAKAHGRSVPTSG